MTNHSLLKRLLPVGLLLGLLLLAISARQYPGGYNADPSSMGFYWAHNFFSDLLDPMAINGDPNVARPWAVAGVLAISLSLASFFYRFSERIPYGGSARVVRWSGIAASLFGLLVIIPSQHDIMVLLSGICTLLVFFYLMVLVMPSRQPWLKVASVVFLMLFYLATAMYFGRWMVEYLPLMQKLLLLIQAGWVVWLDHAVEREDMLPGKTAGS
ncbi:MAG: hypothetical protein NWR72_05590 [Bacteroidia bacterium]|nr:hypothetical protein [Bacteroidia bacterium]